MKNKWRVLLSLLVFLLIFSTALSCKNTPPQFQRERPDYTAGTEREITPPDQTALENLEAAASRTNVARLKAIDIDSPFIFPRDWESATAFYAQVERRRRTSTLREIQEATIRYHAIADAFEALSAKTLILSEEERIELAAAGRTQRAAELAARAAEPAPVAVAPPRIVTPPPVVAPPIVVTPVDPPPPPPPPVVVVPVDPPPVVVPELVVVAVPLPAQYTVRPWSVSQDSLRSIAARPWVYNNESEWRILYNANISKMPQPDNPDMIMPGMILDIPSIRGEFRQGMWDPNLSYPHIDEQ